MELVCGWVEGGWLVGWLGIGKKEKKSKNQIKIQNNKTVKCTTNTGIKSNQTI